MPDIAGFTVEVDPADRAHEPVVRQKDDGVEISVPSGVRFSHPVRITWMFPERGEKTALVVHVGAGSKIVVVEKLAMNYELPARPEVGSGGGIRNYESSWNHTVEVFLDSGAEVELISQQTVDASMDITIRQRSSLKDNAKISWKNVTLGGHSVDQTLESHLEGANAASSIDWMFFATGDEKYQLSARNVFDGRSGGGEITMKGVAEGKGHVRCDGLINIGLKGGGTDTYLTQDVLMLDKTAKVDAVPGLEIKTNDVKASHSATVSRVTDEDLFYFAARGITEKEAKRMFVEGFLGDLIGHIDDLTAREEILAAVEAKYGAGR